MSYPHSLLQIFGSIFVSNQLFEKTLFSKISHLGSWTCYRVSWPSGVSWLLLRAPWPGKPAFSNWLSLDEDTFKINRGDQTFDVVRWSKVPIAVSSPSSVPLEAINLPLTNLLIEQFATRVPVLEKRPVRRGTKQKRTSPLLVALWQAGQVISRCSQISRLVGWPWYALSFWCNICKSQVVKVSAFFIRGRFCSTHLLQGRVLNHEDGKTCAWLFYSELRVCCSCACR